MKRILVVAVLVIIMVAAVLQPINQVKADGGPILTEKVFLPLVVKPEPVCAVDEVPVPNQPEIELVGPMLVVYKNPYAGLLYPGREVIVVPESLEAIFSGELNCLKKLAEEQYPEKFLIHWDWD